jgi:hypothetical protein
MAVCGLLAVFGCGSVGVPPSSGGLPEPIAPGCRLAGTVGDVSVILRGSGELVIVGGVVDLYRSGDLGRSWRREALPVECGWPDVAEIDGRLVVSCSERRPPSRLLVIAEADDGGWSAPVEVAATDERFIDTDLLVSASGELLAFATHIDRPDNLDRAVYTIRQHRSVDGGATWSAGETVVAGRRGEHIEDTRSVALEDGGGILLVYERERAEGRASRIVQLRSADGGRSWSAPEVVWRGGDLEPGGYVRFADGELWLVASSDERAGRGSYDRATILARSSSDGGRSWSDPRVLVDRENQISFGGVALPDGRVLLPSLRFYNQGARRSLSLYAVERSGSGPAVCASPPLSRQDFEDEFGDQFSIR